MAKKPIAARPRLAAATRTLHSAPLLYYIYILYIYIICVPTQPTRLHAVMHSSHTAPCARARELSRVNSAYVRTALSARRPTRCFEAKRTRCAPSIARTPNAEAPTSAASLRTRPSSCKSGSSCSRSAAVSTRGCMRLARASELLSPLASHSPL